MSAATPSKDASWLRQEGEQTGLRRYLITLRDRWWIVALTLALTTAAALLYVATAEKMYEAQADILVTPVSGGDDVTVGLGLIQESNDPTRDVSTAARYITSLPVASRVRTELKLQERPQELLRQVDAEPLAQSSLVTITAQASSPKLAADLANAFAGETVGLRTDQLRAQLDRTIPVLRERLAQMPSGQSAGSDELAARVAALESLRGVPDPTLRVATPASPPDQQSAPRPVMSLGVGILGGLVLGLGGAFALQAIDPRLRREEQLRELYNLPILARVPLERHSRKRGDLALRPEELSGSTAEAFRTLRASLAAALGSEFRSGSVLVTGSSPGEGKTTAAINLANALVAAGNRVILIEADVHRPAIGQALGVRPQFGLSAVLIRSVPLADALVTTDEYGPDLQLLLVDRPGHSTADRLALPTARQLVHDAEELADYVIIDAPPLTEVVDVLPLAQEVQGVLLVARLDRTKLRRLIDLGEILEQNSIRPVGVALIGVERARSAYYTAGSEDAATDRLRTVLQD